MSDLYRADTKMKEGASWREYVTVEIGDEELELCHRDLFTDEFSHAMDIIGEESFARMQEQFAEMDDFDIDESDIERIEELQSKDDLTDDERAELEEYAEKTGGVDGMMAIISDPSVVEGARYAARLGVVPDDDDIESVLEMTFSEQEEVFGDTAKTRDQAEELAQKRVVSIVENSKPRTGFTDVILGLNVLFSSLGGN